MSDLDAEPHESVKRHSSRAAAATLPGHKQAAVKTSQQLLDDSGEDTCSLLQRAAAAAKLKGNALYQQAQHHQAISLYSVSQSLCFILLGFHNFSQDP